jgi:hypothetical protein
VALIFSHSDKMMQANGSVSEQFSFSVAGCKAKESRSHLVQRRPFRARSDGLMLHRNGSLRMYFFASSFGKGEVLGAVGRSDGR